ncbi:MAG: heme A synthase [Cytophagales bacterium CG18_big_fil_WC_8_21_14_2_50_42_9]|nr:MAG: heme A synthase [Cytophagales bacterium CG18_big_fil_WC_8_21_14_2_50_42_9]
MVNKSFSSKRFRNIGVLTIVAVYFLILVGGIVRSTGSGMGCPDWPKCFGTWVPPTEVNQLPANYREIYRDQRIQKNQRLAATLHTLGFTEVASQLQNNPAAHIETEFNATKTWIEYVNRLVGVLIGIFIFLTLLFSFAYYRHDKVIVILSVLSVLLVGLQAWLGSIVVSTNLLPVTITLHMALALVMLGILIYAVARSQESELNSRTFPYSGFIYFMLWLVVFFSFFQTLLGTQVREMIDVIAANNNYLRRENWISQLDISFYIHRSFSSLVLFTNLYLAYQLFKLKDGLMNRLIMGLVFLIVLEIIFGVIMANWAIPAVLQPLHLVTASLIFGIQFLMLIIYLYAVPARRVVKVVA